MYLLLEGGKKEGRNDEMPKTMSSRFFIKAGENYPACKELNREDGSWLKPR